MEHDWTRLKKIETNWTWSPCMSCPTVLNPTRNTKGQKMPGSLFSICSLSTSWNHLEIIEMCLYWQYIPNPHRVECLLNPVSDLLHGSPLINLYFWLGHSWFIGLIWIHDVVMTSLHSLHFSSHTLQCVTSVTSGHQDWDLPHSLAQPCAQPPQMPFAQSPGCWDVDGPGRRLTDPVNAGSVKEVELTWNEFVNVE